MKESEFGFVPKLERSREDPLQERKTIKKYSTMMHDSSGNLEAASVTETYNSDLETAVERGEASASFPAPDEIRATVTPHRKSGFRVYSYILIGTVLILALVIGLAIGLRQDDGSEAQGISFNEPPPRQANSTELIDYFTNNLVSDPFLMSNPASPQGMAIEWLAERDGLNLPVPLGSIATDEGYQLLERFVLAIVYYSTGGAQWRNQVGFLSGNDVCTWGGLRFNGRNFFDFGVVCTGAGSARHMGALYLGK